MDCSRFAGGSLVVASLLMVVQAGAYGEAQSLDEVQAAVDTLVSSRMTEQGGVGLVVGIVRNGDTVFIPYGETVRGTGQKPTSSTLFQIGSITKTFTAALLALSVDQGLVRFD